MDLEKLIKKLSESSQPVYWRFMAESDNNCCERCRNFNGKIFRDDDPAKPALPLHPHCRCSFQKATAEESKNAMETVFPKALSLRMGNLYEIIMKIKNIYDFKVPKPPRKNDTNANWLYLTWMWFFEQGKNPCRFSSDSPESQDIANSYSMKKLKDDFFKTGKIPKLWQFTGPGTAAGNYGEVEWFLGSYSIKDFKLENGIASFTVCNKSGWRSGTRLPKSWSDAIREKTSLEISELVTDAPRGMVIRTKLENSFPGISNFPGVSTILKALPSFGGDWEQCYEIRMEWKK